MSISRRRLIAAPLLLALPALAQEGVVTVEGQAFERRVHVAGQELLLNGTGIRAVAWFKGYAAALYLARGCTTAAQVVQLPGAKRLQLRMLQNVPAAEFAKAFRKGVERNTDAAALPRLAKAMRSFESIVHGVGKVQPGDRIDLDLEPGRGTTFSLNGTLRGEAIAGDELYTSLLRSFVGEQPYDSKMRAGLLAGRS